LFLGITRYASEALRELSPARSQALTLARLSEQGASMPAAAEALTRVAEQLNGLSERWETAHARAAEAQQKSIEGAFAHLHGEVSKAAADAGKSLQQVLTQQIEQLLRKTSESVAEHARETGRTLDRELVARRDSDALLRKGLSEELAALQAGIAQSSETQAALVSAQVERLEASLGRSAAQQGEQLAQQKTLANEHMATLAHASQALSGQLEQDAQARKEDAVRLFDAVGERLTTAGSELGSIAQAVSAQLTTRMDAEHTLAERTREAMATLETQGKALGEALTRQERAVEALLSGARERLIESSDQAQSEARAALTQVVSLAGDQAERLLTLEQKLEDSQAAQASALSAELTAHAERLSLGLSGTSGVVQEAAELLKVSSIELGAVAEMFAKSVERQREAASTWIESLGELEGAVERAGRGAAADALGDQLASTQEVFARQLQFQRELFEQLRMLRAPAPSPSVHGEHDVSA
jgi:myosin heavy subunit